MHFWAVRKVTHHFIPLSCLSPSCNQDTKKSSLFAKLLHCVKCPCLKSVLRSTVQLSYTLCWTREARSASSQRHVVLHAVQHVTSQTFKHTTRKGKTTIQEPKYHIGGGWDPTIKPTQKQWWKWGEQGNSGSDMSDSFYHCGTHPDSLALARVTWVCTRLVKSVVVPPQILVHILNKYLTHLQKNYFWATNV